jgi:hypothetical protein
MFMWKVVLCLVLCSGPVLAEEAPLKSGVSDQLASIVGGEYEEIIAPNTSGMLTYVPCVPVARTEDVHYIWPLECIIGMNNGVRIWYYKIVPSKAAMKIIESDGAKLPPLVTGPLAGSGTGFSPVGPEAVTYPAGNGFRGTTGTAGAPK